MSIASELTRIQNAKAGIKSAIEAKGVTVGDGTIDTYPAKINEIQTGGGSVDEYFNTTISGGNSYSVGSWINAVKKLPPITASGQLLTYCFKGYLGNELDLTNVITSNALYMQEMFKGCRNITELNLTNFDTSNARNMSYMFDGCSSLTSLDLSSFNTSYVTNMKFMFSNCNNLSSLNVSNFDTSRVTDMSYMFRYCNLLPMLSVSNFNTSLVTNMDSMFYGDETLESLDLSSFSTPALTKTSYMFSGCYHLKNINLSNFDFTNVTRYTDMFYNIHNDCYILVKDATAKEWITSKFTNLTNVHYVGEEG